MCFSWENEMNWKTDLEWIRRMDELQGDIPDPAPYRTRRDNQILEARRIEQEATGRNGHQNGHQNGSMSVDEAESLPTEALVS